MAVTPARPLREPFTEEPRPARPGAAPGDPVRRAAGPVRASLAVLLVLAAPLAEGVPHDRIVQFGVFVAVFWIPVAGLVAGIARRHPGRGVDAAAVGVDISLLALVHSLVSPMPDVVLAALLAVVAVSTYLAGRGLGALAGGAGVLVLAASSAVGGGVVDVGSPFTLVVYSAVVVIVAGLVDAVAIDRWHASTGLVRLHEKSDAILTGVGEAVVVTGPAGGIAQWNRAATSTFGCADDEARGQACADVLGLLHEVRPLDCSQGCALLALAQFDDPGAVDVEVWRRSPTGTRQPLLASVSPVLGVDGEVVEVVHSFRDITRLKQADEAKTLFLATASHELKTPLTVIRGFSQMLLLPDTVLDAAERAAALRAIDVRAGQLTAIVDRLLMSSRIDAGRIELSPVAVDIGPILRERADALEGATSRPVELDLSVDLPAPHCDPDAFTTVVDHLLDNAVKYSPNGGVLTVTAQGLEFGVEIVFADEGVGMTAEQAAHCFERFWQAEATDVRRFGGTGIGLYIVRSLVEGMGGSISVVSGPGAGSSFRVVLRRADQVDTDDLGRPGDDVPVEASRGETTMIREYMRQLGVPLDQATAGGAVRRP
ncbi:MAG: PAS domain-containing sensor histidine kinase [Acidimicrobiia bacterium]|nr:PAS domain-containing sensor histidine kinase [Acidimicrobiia bacterium]